MTASRRHREISRVGERARLVAAMTACQSESLVARQLAMLAFAGEIAHDVRNPLNAAKLQLHLLERRTRHLQDPSLRVPLELATKELARLAQLLDDVLAFTHPLERALHEGDGANDIDLT